MEWIKRELFDQFNIKDLRKAKIIIQWENTRDLQAKTLKINQKAYIQDLLESEEMTSYHSTVLPIKAAFTIMIDQVGDDAIVDLISYQQLVGKLIYLAFRT